MNPLSAGRAYPARMPRHECMCANRRLHVLHTNFWLALRPQLTPDIGLTGTKLGCGEGGCGACTVMVSHAEGGRLHHRAVNACLCPLYAVEGMAVVTVEGERMGLGAAEGQCVCASSAAALWCSAVLCNLAVQPQQAHAPHSGVSRAKHAHAVMFHPTQASEACATGCTQCSSSWRSRMAASVASAPPAL